MRVLFSAITAATLITTPVLAEDWTGFYLGGGVGWADVDGPGALDGDDVSFGVHAGYDYDFGDFVLGGEVEIDRADIDLGNGPAQVDNVSRLKLKAGYDFGPALGYAVLGGARVDTSVGNENGALYGLGVAVPINEQVSLSGELLRHDFNNFNGSGVDADATSVNIRASFRF